MIKNYKSQLLKLVACIGLVSGNYTLNAQVTDLSYTGNLQVYVVPSGVSEIRIDARGAEGGSSLNDGGGSVAIGEGGKGAWMTGTFSVSPGDVLSVLVGGKGTDSDYVGGGGGGTFVWETATNNLLIAAGGGGGAGSSETASEFFDGIDASVGENGTNGNNLMSGGGVEGSGGTGIDGAIYFASGGAGWNSDGMDGSDEGCANMSTGGQRPLDGGAGGLGGDDGISSNGGYGGGGGGNGRCGAIGGGGGGGYSGGGAGAEMVITEYNGGGGGGSFNSGNNQIGLVGIGTGDGSVVITPLAYAGIQELPDGVLSIYPNPTIDEFSIELKGTFSYEVYTSYGKKIVDGYGNNKGVVLMDNVSSGIYFVKVNTDKGSKTVRLVKQ